LLVFAYLTKHSCESGDTLVLQHTEFRTQIPHNVQMTSNFNALRPNNQLYCWKISNKYVINYKMLKITASLGLK